VGAAARLQADVGGHPNLLPALDALLRGETADALSAAMHRIQQKQQLKQQQAAAAAAQAAAQQQEGQHGLDPSGAPAAAAGEAGAAVEAAVEALDLRVQVLELLVALEGGLSQTVEEDCCTHILLSLQQLLMSRDISTRVMVLQVRSPAEGRQNCQGWCCLIGQSLAALFACARVV
jgi:hypothetical protein